MNSKLEKILIGFVLFAIFGGLGLFVLGMIISTLWISIVGFILAGVGGVSGTVLRVILAYKSIPRSVIEEAKAQMTKSKQEFKKLPFKQRIKTILLISVIVLSWIGMAIFGNLRMYTHMFICLGVFVGIGVIAIIVAVIKAYFNY